MNTNPSRTVALTREINVDGRTVDMACSSEEPYARWWGTEILDHSPGAIDLSRLADGRHPLLLNHCTDDQVGVIESVTLGGDRILRARARFSKAAEADEVFQDVVDGIRSLVSIGYCIDELEEEKTLEDGTVVCRRLTFDEFKTEMRALHGDDFDYVTRATAAQSAMADAQPVFRVTRWQPFEVSIVAIPADATVGVGRSAGAESNERPGSTAAPAIQPAPQPPQETRIMNAPAIIDGQADQKVAATEITRIAKQYKDYGAESLALDFISQGKSVEEFQAALLEKRETVNKLAASSGDLGLSNKEAQRYSVLRAMRGLVDKDWKHAPFERECHEAILKRAGVNEAPNNGIYVPVEIQKRDMTSAGASGSNYLVPTDNLAGSFIDLLRNRALVARLGATMLPGLSGNVTIPKQTAAGTAYWLTNEATAITESQPTIGQLALTPKNIGAYTEISRQLMLQNSPAADALVMNDIAKVIAIGIDLAAFEGSGASGQPTGISNTAGIGSVTGTSIALAGIVEFQTDVAGSNALAGNCAYVTTPTVAGLLAQRQRFSSTDTPIWEGNILDGKVMGFTAASTLQLTAASMIFGDFSQVVIGEWGMLELALNPYANFTAAISGIRGIQTVDVGVRVAGAFSRATSIT